MMKCEKYKCKCKMLRWAGLRGWTLVGGVGSRRVGGAQYSYIYNTEVNIQNTM